LAGKIKKQLDINDYCFGHLTLIPSLHCLVKCRSHSLAVYNNEFILDNARISSENHTRPQNHLKPVIY